MTFHLIIEYKFIFSFKVDLVNLYDNNKFVLLMVLQRKKRDSSGQLKKFRLLTKG